MIPDSGKNSQEDFEPDEIKLRRCLRVLSNVNLFSFEKQTLDFRFLKVLKLNFLWNFIFNLFFQNLKNDFKKLLKNLLKVHKVSLHHQNERREINRLIICTLSLSFDILNNHLKYMNLRISQLSLLLIRNEETVNID